MTGIDRDALRALAVRASFDDDEFTIESDFAGIGMGLAERLYYAAVGAKTVLALLDALDDAEVAVAAARPIIEAEVRRSLLWECPDCAFGFDRMHTDEDGGGYSCPVCELAEVREHIAAEIEAERSALFGSADDPYQRGWSQMRGKAARIARGTA